MCPRGRPDGGQTGYRYHQISFRQPLALYKSRVRGFETGHRCRGHDDNGRWKGRSAETAPAQQDVLTCRLQCQSGKTSNRERTGVSRGLRPSALSQTSVVDDDESHLSIETRVLAQSLKHRKSQCVSTKNWTLKENDYGRQGQITP